MNRASRMETAAERTQQRRDIMNRNARILLGLSVMLGLAGCAPSPFFDEHFGDAVRQARLAQTLHPEASRNLEPVVGLDGVAAQASIVGYEKSFQKPPAVTNVINIGGTIGGGNAGMAPAQ